MKKLAYSMIVLTTLSACGGGSSGVASTATTTMPTAAAFTNFSSVPSDGAYVMSGKALTVDYNKSASGTVTGGTVNGPQDATVTVTNSGGSVVKEAISTSGSSASWATANGDTISPSTSTNLTTLTSKDGNTVAVQGNANSLGYNYQDYGIWDTGPATGARTAGAVSVGAATPVSGMPTSGSATYNGSSVGTAVDSSGNPYITTSTMKITTDFNTVNLASTGTTATNANTNVTSSASGLDFTGTGSVSGSGFTATIATGSTLTNGGSASGTFYGPAAQEAGGTFQASGTGGVAYMGAFGGKQ